MNQINFILNGLHHSAEFEDGETLLKYLRNTACLKGTKESCGMGQCGACSVLINGKLRRSCVTLMKTLEGKQVETIEGISSDGSLTVIQRSFLDVGAVQCGYCIPGMVIASKALLLEHPDPSEEEIREGLKHNYCRCTGYVKIIEAVKLAAARMKRETQEQDREYDCPNQKEIEKFRTGEHTFITSGRGEKVPKLRGRALGHSVWDVDGPAKVTGTLKFCDDFEAEEFGENEMLHGAFVWAPAPKAKICKLDLAEAERAPGVRRVLTWKDVPGNGLVGTWTPEQPVFCRDQVNFLGDMLALVVADTEKQAREAARLAQIEYEEMEGVYTIPEGYAKESFLLHTGREAGDVEKAKKAPDIVKVKVSKDMERQEHACMETESAIGYGNGDFVTVYSCTQSPFEIRRMLAPILNLPEEKIRIVATPLGGGFGSKCDSVIEAQAAVAGLVMQKPVKVTLTRQESLIASSKRHGYHTDYEIGFTRDGKFSYLDCRMFSDGGPYMTESYGTLMTGCLMAGGPYIVDNIRIEGSAIRTNNVLGGAFRGYGINQAAISIETAVDMMAEKLHMDPFEIRRKNAVRAGSCSVGGELLKDSVGLLDTIDQCEAKLKEALKEYEGVYPQGSRVLGYGVASGFKNVGVGKGIFTDDGACKLTLQADGRIQMICSGTDMGQGFRTAMVQIAAEALNRDVEDFDILIGDTRITVPTGQSVSERQTLCGGRAVYEACLNLKRELEKNPWKPGEIRKAQYYYLSPPTFAIGDYEGARAKGVPYRNFPAYAYTTQAVIVEVDQDTGKTKLLKVIAAHDVGRVINPQKIEGQLQGSCSMGQGYALSEQYPCRNGYPVFRQYRELGLPKAEDTPDYEMILIENPEPTGPFGAKGISEVATVPITPAILNAIYNAVGVRINRIPATPEVILDAIRRKNRSASPCVSHLTNEK
ncbi:MAG: molybdopterin-dependent oxidoreductase [Enterocloster sp.]